MRRQVFVEHDDALTPLDILTAVENAGFTPALSGTIEHNTERQVLLKRFGIAGLGMMQVMMVAIALYAGDFAHMEPIYRDLLNFVSLLLHTCRVLFSDTLFTGAIRSMRNRSLNMDVPVALAIAIAFTTQSFSHPVGYWRRLLRFCRHVHVSSAWSKIHKRGLTASI